MRYSFWLGWVQQKLGLRIRHFRLFSFFALEDGGGAHARANAHGHDAVRLVGAMKPMQQRGDLAGARAPQRMSKGDGSTYISQGNAHICNYSSTSQFYSDVVKVESERAGGS